MRARAILLISVSVVLAGSVSSVAASNVARSLGEFLGSEKACKLQINYSAVQKYIRENVDAGDLEFTSLMQSAATVTEYQYGNMSTGLQVAHCEQMTRLGRQLGLTN